MLKLRGSTILSPCVCVYVCMCACVMPDGFNQNNSGRYDTLPLCSSVRTAWISHPLWPFLPLEVYVQSSCAYCTCSPTCPCTMCQSLCKGPQWSQLATAHGDEMAHVMLTWHFLEQDVR